MQILRVEDENACGPYIGQNVVIEFDNHTHLNGRPNPYRDTKLQDIDVPDSHVYGFANRSQFKAWFKQEDRKLLKRKGFLLAVYEVHESRVIVGSCQVVFEYNAAKRLKQFKI